MSRTGWQSSPAKGLAAYLMLFMALPTAMAGVTDPVPRLDLEAAVGLDTNGDPTRISGSMIITGLPPSDICFYLPYNDPDYGQNRGTQQRVDRLTRVSGRTQFDGGHQEISPSKAFRVEPLAEHIVRIVRAAPSDRLKLSFSSKMPLPPAHVASDWIFDGFYPKLLPNCPTELPNSSYLQYTAPTEIHFKITYPSALLYLGVAKVGSTNDHHHAQASGSLLAQRYVFGLGRDMKSLHLEVNEIPFEIHYREDWFLELIPSIEKLLPVYKDLLGNAPFEKFIFVETSELQRADLPAIIAINRPRQSAFNSLVTGGTNWYHWLVARALASQWFGAAVSIQTPDDEWLIEGSAEYAALEALRQIPERFNLFQTRADGSYFLSVDFMEALEISAAVMRRSAPFSLLVNSQMQSERPRRLQFALSFVRHAIALNQVSAQVGNTRFFAFLRSVAQSHRTRFLTPKSLIAHFGHLPSRLSPIERAQAAKALQNWWLTAGWPDFALHKFEKQQVNGSNWRSTVEIEQKGNLDFAPLVSIIDYAGEHTKVRARRQGDSWVANIETVTEPRHVEIDPDHEAFDTDRFNNSDRWPALKFFPGSANTLSDDLYTVIWAPYAYRNPGEPISIAVQAALFRYINGIIFFNGALSPTNNGSLYSIRHRYEYPNVAIHGDLQVEQNYDADRIAEASVIRSPVFDMDPEISVSARLRHKQRMGDPDSGHLTVVGGVSVRPAGVTDACKFTIGIDWESSPPDWHPDFSYNRRSAIALGDCRISAFSLGTRVFVGKVSFDGEVPEAAMFKPTNLNEARLRIDASDLPPVEELTVISNDFLFPLIVPLPDNSFVLSRRIKGRLFYDLGWTMSPTTDYRAGGLGFSLPFGGDVSGAGSFTFSQLSLLAVLYSKIGNDTSRGKGVVFNFTGQL